MTIQELASIGYRSMRTQHGLMMGQYAERSKVYGLVLQALERIADDDTEEEA